MMDHSGIAGSAPVAAKTQAPFALTLIGIGAATAAAHIGNNFTTYLLGGLMDRFGFSPFAMGAWNMAETLSYAAAMFLVAPRARGLDARALAMLASMLVIAAQAGSAARSIWQQGAQAARRGGFRWGSRCRRCSTARLRLACRSSGGTTARAACSLVLRGCRWCSGSARCCCRAGKAMLKRLP
jgi:hypothetical protein